MSYVILAVAVLVMLGLKFLLMKRTFSNSEEKFTNPKSFAGEVVDLQLKKQGLAKTQQEFSSSNLHKILKANTEYLCSLDKDTGMPSNIQKLRNICLGL